MRDGLGVLYSLYYRGQHLLRHLRAPDVRQRIALASRRYETSAVRIVARIIRLYALDRFAPNESLMYGLVNPAVPITERRLHFSEERLHGLQGVINAPEAAICRDKLAFHSFCRDHGFPVPILYGVISPLGSRSESGKLLGDATQWSEFVRNELPSCVIAKPRSGKQGRDIRRFVDPPDDVCSGLHALEESAEDWLVQECLVPHDALVELTGTTAVSSLRVFTLMDEYGTPRIMDAYLRVICGESITDNISDYASGRLSGNVVATPDLASGIIQRAWQANPDGVGYQWLDVHPLTGHGIKGFTVPYWREVCELLQAATVAFLPIRTAGWDVAITNRGPVLLEVNERFQNAAIGPATVEFRRALERECDRLRGVSDSVRKRYIEDQI